MKTITTILLLLTFISCGKQGQVVPTAVTTEVYNNVAATPELFSYELSDLSCTTGELTFETYELACEGLKDHELNLGCAEEQRRALFENEECAGEFDLE